MRAQHSGHDVAALQFLPLAPEAAEMGEVQLRGGGDGDAGVEVPQDQAQGAEAGQNDREGEDDDRRQLGEALVGGSAPD